MQALTESLFYSGGTITTSDIKETTHKFYNVAFNDNYMFIFSKDHKLVKVVKYELQHEFAYKVLKTKVKINNRFGEMLNDPFWSCCIKHLLNNIIDKTKAVN